MKNKTKERIYKMIDTKILIVDDDAAICDMLKIYFEKEGYDVKIANDGVEGINYFKMYDPDLVLLDIMLPGIDGMEVCRRLSALAGAHWRDEASRALRKRVGQIALSVAKNIPGYHLPQDVAREVMAYIGRSRRELAGYALRSGDVLVALQGALLCVSPRLFIGLYARAAAQKV